ncbi:hypothetical protein LCGC14_0734520 [marine sediment metagenome]|uniref:Uncharacterized protein n=1 Tax=marine sediment metagenome TaxID=412755 RepID=A0A0F9STP6_9ZZZZ
MSDETTNGSETNIRRAFRAKLSPGPEETVRTDLWYWSWGARSLISLLPFGKPTRLAIEDMSGFCRRLRAVVRCGLRKRTPSPQEERFLIAFAHAMWSRLQADINNDLVEDYQEAHRAAELQSGATTHV